MSEEKIIEIINISKAYAGVQALSNVNMSIQKGEIHCLVGENGSGKSTLIKVMSGVVKPDTGDIIINGKLFQTLNPIDAIKEGVQVIYQDLSLFPDLTVAENIALNQYIETSRKFVNWKEIKKIAKLELTKVNIDLDLYESVQNLSIANKQLVAICRALTQDAKLIIMDEPTSALTKKEIDYIFSVILNLKKKGISVLFISHKLSEVLQISEKVTILRDGFKVGEYKTRELNNDKLSYLMTGKEIENTAYNFEIKDEKQLPSPLIEVKDFTHKKYFKNINFKLWTGEILGIAGVLGSGRTELAKSIFGMMKIVSGEIYINGKIVKIRNVQDAVKNGLGYLPEDRLREGLFLEQPVSINLIITILNKLLNKLNLISNKLKRIYTEKQKKEFDIKMSSLEADAKTLSGGNQQKICLAKWIATNPKIFILDGPTVGIDVASKSNIHNIMRDLASRGVGIIMISDEIPEILQNCNRALIMKEGKIIKEVLTSEITEDRMYEVINS